MEQVSLSGGMQSAGQSRQWPPTRGIPEQEGRSATAEWRHPAPVSLPCGPRGCTSPAQTRQHVRQALDERPLVSEEQVLSPAFPRPSTVTSEFLQPLKSLICLAWTSQGLLCFSRRKTRNRRPCLCLSQLFLH